jgi:hypothetical protein
LKSWEIGQGFKVQGKGYRKKSIDEIFKHIRDAKPTPNVSGWYIHRTGKASPWKRLCEMLE